MKKNSIYNLSVSAVCLALCLLLPFLTMQLPSIGSALCPMHIPVLLCAFLCGPTCAAAVGLIAPLLRSSLFFMPPLFPAATAMSFEMATYGLIAGLLYKKLPRKTYNIYISLITAMLVGRIVWGIVSAILYGASGSAFTFAAFIAGGFTGAIPGIILQIVLIPMIVYAFNKNNLVKS